MKEVLGYKRFDRHACFTPEMMHMTMDVIKEVKDMPLIRYMVYLMDISIVTYLKLLLKLECQ